MLLHKPDFIYENVSSIKIRIYFYIFYFYFLSHFSLDGNGNTVDTKNFFWLFQKQKTYILRYISST